VQRFQLLTLTAFALALAAIIGACDDRPTAPTPTPSTTPGTPVTITDLTISGPTTIAPGETTQFAATARQSDGSTRNVTNEVTWAAGSQSILAVSSTGAATGRERGESWIQASLGGRHAVINEVIVVPAGTFRLTGRLTDSASGVIVFDARVEVTAGIGQGLATTATGLYRLYGVAGDVEIRVTADGYQEERKRIHVTTHQSVEFNLILTRPRSDVSGTYTLSVTAAAECRASLPAEAITRTYTAVLRQQGPGVNVELQGARFVVNGNRTHNRFGGIVEPSGIRFFIEGPLDFYYTSYGPDVVEHLTDTSFFTMSGTVQSRFSSGAVVSGILDGLIETVRSGVPGGLERIASCRSTQHQFVLSR
jgi:hypothetical protein